MSLKRALFYTICISFNLLQATSFVPIDYMLSRIDGFSKYLANLHGKMSFPTFVIKAGAHAQGYSQPEVDGIPASFPFICESKYKSFLYLLSDTETEALVNKLLDMFTQATTRVSDHALRRKKLHEIIHRLNLEIFGLNPNTSTKKFSEMVEKRQLDVNKLCRVQIAMFFVKYYLDL